MFLLEVIEEMFENAFTGIGGLPLVGPEPMCGGTDWWNSSTNPQTDCWEWQWSSDVDGGVIIGIFRLFLRVDEQNLHRC